MPKRKNWTEIDIERAIEMINDGKKVSRACKECNVPRSTINDRIKKGTPERPGTKTLLTQYE